jgi:hypothetical protein
MRTVSKEKYIIWTDNRVLRRIFGLRRDDVATGWRKLHNEKLRIFSATDIRVTKSRMRWARQSTRMGRYMHTQFLDGKLEGRKRLGRPRRE